MDAELNRISSSIALLQSQSSLWDKELDQSGQLQQKWGWSWLAAFFMVSNEEALADLSQKIIRHQTETSPKSAVDQLCSKVMQVLHDSLKLKWKDRVRQVCEVVIAAKERAVFDKTVKQTQEQLQTLRTEASVFLPPQDKPASGRFRLPPKVRGSATPSARPAKPLSEVATELAERAYRLSRQIPTKLSAAAETSYSEDPTLVSTAKSIEQEAAALKSHLEGSARLHPLALQVWAVRPNINESQSSEQLQFADQTMRALRSQIDELARSHPNSCTPSFKQTPAQLLQMIDEMQAQIATLQSAPESLLSPDQPSSLLSQLESSDSLNSRRLDALYSDGSLDTLKATIAQTALLPKGTSAIDIARRLNVLQDLAAEYSARADRDAGFSPTFAALKDSILETEKALEMALVEQGNRELAAFRSPIALDSQKALRTLHHQLSRLKPDREDSPELFKLLMDIDALK